MMANADLVRQKLTDTLQASSLKQLVEERRRERETFVLLDCSVSMCDPIGLGNPTRCIDSLRQIAAELRETIHCPQVGFGILGNVGFIDVVPEPTGSTPLAEAIEFCRRHHAKHLIVVSDGLPNNPAEALQEARAFPGPIDVFYVGSDEQGSRFLQELAHATRGQYQKTTLAAPKQLATSIRGLLASHGEA